MLNDAPGTVLVLSAALWGTLATLSFHDARRLLIPDAWTAALALSGLAGAFALDPEALPGRVLAMATGGVGAWAFASGYRAIRGRDGLGFGDVKLIAAAGGWIGLEGYPSLLMTACISALAAALARRVTRGRIGAMPFAPHLSLGLWLVWCLGPVR
jgi:leader peptidase (prepilin peptidase)/N-methyltransferase